MLNVKPLDTAPRTDHDEDMTTTDQDCAPADTAAIIARQIPRWLKMAVGYRNPVATGTGLQFDCKGRAPYRVIITLDEGADLYAMQVWTKSRAPRALLDTTHLDVEQMVAIIDSIDRGTLHA